MNKTAIKNFAMRARNNLMAAVEQKAFEIGITKNGIKEIETFQEGFRVNDRVFKASEVEQRKKLIQKIREKGFEQVIEEVAYTWFNRFIALRFMEVNEYLPTGVRVLSSTDTNKTEPDIIRDALNIELDIDKNVVYQYQDMNDTEELFKYLLIKQCNELSKIMPVMFEEIEDYTELLLPDHLLTEGSVIRDLVESIEEEDFKEQVEIIGWLYQYYISEKKDEVFEGLKKNVKITKENIPAATQLFTPGWIVKYMVENSLGRLWLESHPNEELKAEWKYYLEEAEQETDVRKQLEEIRNKGINPEEIKVLDPAMGSGHILVYAFDVLYEIYKSVGYPERDIPKLILEKNLYGLDIDDRAGQLAYFALMMKARSKNRRIFREKIELNLCSIQESNGFPKEAIDLLVNRKDTELEKVVHRKDAEYLIEVFHDAKEYGSILEVKDINLNGLLQRIKEIRIYHPADLLEYQYRDIILEKIPSLIKQALILSGQYHVVCTNPPYMAFKGMNSSLGDYLKTHYDESKYDLFSIFIEKCLRYTAIDKYTALITQHSWMFLVTFEKFRSNLLETGTINSLLHLGTKTFDEIGGEVVQSTSFILQKTKINDYIAKYIRLVDYNSAEKKKTAYLNKEFKTYNVKQSRFDMISGKQVAYWISDGFIKSFENPKLSEYAFSDGQLLTGNNDKYLRFLWEVRSCDISKDVKWVLHAKGGENRKWFGNIEYVVDWSEKAREHYRKNRIARIPPEHVWFRKGIVWSGTSSVGNFAVRLLEENSNFNKAAPTIFVHNNSNLYLFIGILNSKYVIELLNIMNPTMYTAVNDVLNIPIKTFTDNDKNRIDDLVRECINISKNDWDSYEQSWDFKRHPLYINSRLTKSINKAFQIWDSHKKEQRVLFKLHEEELNKIIISNYDLKDELSAEVVDSEITITKADRVQDIKSLISFAVGCMFGRYSLDEEGLIYAGGDFNIDRYKTIIPCKDNILPIADDVYFEEDIVTRFVDFVKVTFGEDALEENLDYIADTLNKKPSETSRQAIRRYFLKDFYKDHVQMYKKRPIYWLFDSGKQDGFKALIYMHRYDPYTVARVRTDYLHKLQKKYDAEVNRLDIVLESNVSQAEKTKVRKKKEDLIKKMQECTVYDQAIAHVANQKIEIDLDDGVAVNYAKFQGVEIPQDEGKKPLKADLLAKI